MYNRSIALCDKLREDSHAFILPNVCKNGGRDEPVDGGRKKCLQSQSELYISSHLRIQALNHDNISKAHITKNQIWWALEQYIKCWKNETLAKILPLIYTYEASNSSM